MKNKRIVSLLFCAAIISQLAAQKISSKKVWSEAEQQVQVLVREAKENRSRQLIFPRSTIKDSIRLVASGDWTSGFFPGMLWFLYEKTSKPEWKNAAQEFTSLMIKEPYNGNSHDVGFKVYCSYGNGLRLTGDTSYKRLILDAAKTLSKRFNPKVGCIRSWDFGKWQYPVIIDNMMNLELLFEATKLSGDSSFHKIAVAHANTTMKNHFRSDYSSYHVVDYDTVKGIAIGKGTHQGYADESAWARGQAWGLYGYTMCYRETGDTAYLVQAENIASFILNHPALPKDLIPYWDFNLPNLEKESRDASAATVIASALYELSGYSKEGKAYKKAADKIIQSLTNHYRNAIGTNHGYLLQHSTGHKPGNSEIDVPLIYADYYYLEALLRSQKNK
jgi:unsaturated chondroitin disaccharide hydrolase